jgi:DNA-binding transcriptional regulator GbsR (MarR family)
MDGKEIEKKIYSTFADIASTLGYSDVHGRIIACLLVKGEPMSLQKLAKETGYSTSMISLSLELLELIGMIKKVKKTGDRKLYISLNDDLLGGLKKAIIIKIQKSIADSLVEFENYKKELNRLEKLEKERIENIIKILEVEINRVNEYVENLSKVSLPEKRGR